MCRAIADSIAGKILHAINGNGAGTPLGKLFAKVKWTNALFDASRIADDRISYTIIDTIIIECLAGCQIERVH